MSTQINTGVFKGALKDKSKFIAFFKTVDEYTIPKYRNLPYFDLKSPVYGAKTKHKGYRPTTYGAVNAICTKYDIARPKFYNTQQTLQNGVTETSKTSHTGTRPVAYEKWEQTPTCKLILREIGADPNSIKNNIRNPNRYKISYKKQSTYLRACYLAWKAMGASTDLLNASLEQWLKVWGKDPKTPDQCHALMKDSQTRLMRYGYVTPLRWVMRRSLDVNVRDKLIVNDDLFRTGKLKRESGQHIDNFFTEQQCLLLPYAVDEVDTLVLAYFGLLFGGRFSALSDITPERFVFAVHELKVFESKVQKWVKKRIYEPETSFMKQYITDYNIQFNEPLFKRSIKAYNDELKATKQYFATTEHPLNWTPTTHTAFKHTCVSQMSLHGVSMDCVSRYVGTDPNTLNQFYRGGSDEKTDEEIGGLNVQHRAATWRAFVIQLTRNFAERYMQLTGHKVNLPSLGVSV